MIFKSGADVRGVKAAAAVWITGAIGMAVGTSYWWLGTTVGAVTFAVMFVSDSFPDPEHQAKLEGDSGPKARRDEPAPAKLRVSVRCRRGRALQQCRALRGARQYDSPASDPRRTIGEVER